VASKGRPNPGLLEYLPFCLSQGSTGDGDKNRKQPKKFLKKLKKNNFKGFLK